MAGASFLLELAATAASTAVPIVAAKVWQLINARITESQADRLANACARAAGRVATAPEWDMTNSAADIKSLQEVLLSEATDQVMLTMKDTIEQLGGTREQIKAMIHGELGKQVGKK